MSDDRRRSDCVKILTDDLLECRYDKRGPLPSGKVISSRKKFTRRVELLVARYIDEDNFSPISRPMNVKSFLAYRWVELPLMAHMVLAVLIFPILSIIALPFALLLALFIESVPWVSICVTLCFILVFIVPAVCGQLWLKKRLVHREEYQGELDRVVDLYGELVKIHSAYHKMSTLELKEHANMLFYDTRADYIKAVNDLVDAIDGLTQGTMAYDKYTRDARLLSSLIK